MLFQIKENNKETLTGTSVVPEKGQEYFWWKRCEYSASSSFKIMYFQFVQFLN